MKIPITDVKCLVQKHKVTGGIFLAFDSATGKYCGTSYGETKHECGKLGSVLEQIMELIQDKLIEPEGGW